MKTWKPTNFKPEYPRPEDGCAFVLGGTMHGEIVQQQPLPRWFQNPVKSATQDDAGWTNVALESYRLEEFRVGQNQRSVWFYVHESNPTDFYLIQALTDLCMFLREARRGS